MPKKVYLLQGSCLRKNKQIPNTDSDSLDVKTKNGKTAVTRLFSENVKKNIVNAISKDGRTLRYVYKLRTTYFVIWSVPYISFIFEAYRTYVPYQGIYVRYQGAVRFFLRTGTVLLH